MQTILTLGDYIKTNLKILCINKNYNNRQISTDVNSTDSKILDNSTSFNV